MPQIGPITVNDGKENETFSPEDYDHSLSRGLYLSSADSSVQQKRLTITARRIDRDAGGRKLRGVFQLPLVHDVDGVPVQYGENSVSFEFKFDARSTGEQRLALAAILRDLLDPAKPFSKGYVVDQGSQF